MSILTPKPSEPGRVVLTMEEAKALGLDGRPLQKCLDEIKKMEEARAAAWFKYKDLPIGATA